MARESRKTPKDQIMPRFISGSALSRIASRGSTASLIPKRPADQTELRSTYGSSDRNALMSSSALLSEDHSLTTFIKCKKPLPLVVEVTEVKP